VLATNEQIEAHWLAIREMMAVMNRPVFRALGHHVLTGPFKGMLITDAPNWDDGNCSLKLLGCYERELWESVEKVIARRPSAVINVGCAEGYYAIGLKRRMPDVPVYAFDINDVTLQQCADLAERNGVQIDTRIGCKKPHELNLGFARALYVLDCEEAELGLLDPVLCYSLSSADIIVECHNHNYPISKELAYRFSSSHDIELINPQLADFQTYEKYLRFLPFGIRASIITEKRPISTAWLTMLAKRRWT
jgi:hypothetical protein